MSKVCFIGHRDYCGDVEILKKVIEKEIEQGANFFTMGTHGNFDSSALIQCKKLREKYKCLEIQIVITSFNSIKKQLLYDDEWGKEYFTPYSDVETVMYEIEECYFKRRITESNKKMIDNCDTLICYVNANQKYGGSKIAMQYAHKKGLKVINLFNDNFE